MTDYYNYSDQNSDSHKERPGAVVEDWNEPAGEEEEDEEDAVDYTDHSHVQPPATEIRNRATTWFINRLYDMLDDPSIAHIISWQPHGRCFVLRDNRALQKILPQYFKITKTSSFLRQLNIYGFTRIARGSDGGGYYHELFLQGRRWLAQTMTPFKVKGTGTRKAAKPDPGFWSMPFVKPMGTTPGTVNKKDSNSSLEDAKTVPSTTVVTPKGDTPHSPRSSIETTGTAFSSCDRRKRPTTDVDSSYSSRLLSCSSLEQHKMDTPSFRLSPTVSVISTETMDVIDHSKSVAAPNGADLSMRSTSLLPPLLFPRHHHPAHSSSGWDKGSAENPPKEDQDDHVRPSQDVAFLDDFVLHDLMDEPMGLSFDDFFNATALTV